MKRFCDAVKRVPWWGWAFGVGFFALQRVMYRLGEWLSRVLGTVSYAFECKIAPIDDLFPLVPAWVLIYVVASYLFWVSGPIVASLTKRRNFVNYLFGLTLAMFVGCLFFAFMPTFMDRTKEGLMSVADRPGFGNAMLAWVYSADGSERAFNLFPSYHCLLSAYCYLGIRKKPEISKGYKIFAVVLNVLIYASTLYTKQHYIIDVFGGVAIAVACYALTERLNPGKKWE